MNRTLAALVVVASLCLAAASTAGAGRAAAVSPTFKQGGRTYRWETIGNSWTCKSAKTWVVKLIGDHIHSSTKTVPLTNGPRGYHCFAEPDSRRGRATSGTCFKGTLAFPGTGFAWFEA
jgi:hypothetical protein